MITSRKAKMPLKPIQTRDPDQTPPQSYTAGQRQVLASHHHSSGPSTGSREEEHTEYKTEGGKKLAEVKIKKSF